MYCLLPPSSFRRHPLLLSTTCSFSPPLFPSLSPSSPLRASQASQAFEKKNGEFVWEFCMKTCQFFFSKLDLIATRVSPCLPLFFLYCHLPFLFSILSADINQFHCSRPRTRSECCSTKRFGTYRRDYAANA